MSETLTIGERQTEAIEDMKKQGFRIVNYYRAGELGDKCAYVVMRR
jgi:hypothetical protein